MDKDAHSDISMSDAFSSASSATEIGDEPTFVHLKRKRADSKCQPSSGARARRQKRPKVRIYVAGCNAFNNLNLNETFLPKNRFTEANDLFGFRLADEGDSIYGLKAFLSWTTYINDGKRRTVGHTPSHDEQCILREVGVQNGKGRLVKPFFKTPEIIESWASLRHLRTDGREHCSLHYPQRESGGTSSAICQIAAWDTGFVMMDTDRRVYTMGDPRYHPCLGRFFEDSSSAEKPVLVTDLPDPIERMKKVVAGGYTVGALTEQGHLYFWGVSTPGTSRQVQAISGLQAQPNYEPVGDDEDIIDVTLGAFHAVALTDKREVFVRGSNVNGQLGLGWSDPKQRASEWTKVKLDLGGYQVEEVVAGPATTFLIARLREEEE